MFFMKSIYLLAALAVGLCSCSQYYYAPTSHNVPLLQAQYDARLAVIAGEGDDDDDYAAIEVQAAFAPVNHLGIMVNHVSAHGGGGGNYQEGSGKLTEIGVGYFVPLSPNNKRGGRFLFEVYGGGGGGRVHNSYDSSTSASMKLARYFVQPAVGFSMPYFNIAFSPRLAMLHYSAIELRGLPGVEDAADLAAISGRPNIFMLEPALTVRGGYKWIKMQAQFCGSTALNNSGFKYLDNTASIALYFSLDSRWYKRVAKR
jgi:hypothetical protein